MNARSMWLSALIAGAAMGLLGNLPLINFVNCILCLWVWLGGGLAVVLYRRFQGGQPVGTQGQAAALGAITGVIGALIGAVVYYATASLSEPLMTSVMQALDIQGGLSLGTQNPASAPGGALVFLLVDIILYPIFGALGGLVTWNILKGRSSQPPTTA